MNISSSLNTDRKFCLSRAPQLFPTNFTAVRARSFRCHPQIPDSVLGSVRQAQSGVWALHSHEWLGVLSAGFVVPRQAFFHSLLYSTVCK